MTQFPHDDQNLVDFLRQNCPEVPPSSPDLEWRICQQVKASPIQAHGHFSRLWLVPPVIAAGLLAFIVGYPTFAPNKPSPAEIAKLEAFMESNWQGTVNDSLENDVWHLTELNSD